MPRKGDNPRAEVGRLYDEYGTGLYRYALMILADAASAEDALHDVFAKLLTQRTSIDDEQRYLWRAVRNQCFSALRRRATSGGGPLIESVGPNDRPEERLALEAAIRDLPADQREVLHLHSFEGMTFQEIADLVGESTNTVSSRYRYAMSKLRRTLT
jgi:RNA polymerase sigma-70 factor (ECF subfamily)